MTKRKPVPAPLRRITSQTPITVRVPAFEVQFPPDIAFEADEADTVKLRVEVEAELGAWTVDTRAHPIKDPKTKVKTDRIHNARARLRFTGVIRPGSALITGLLKRRR